jgi:hypothetical protein
LEMGLKSPSNMAFRLEYRELFAAITFSVCMVSAELGEHAKSTLNMAMRLMRFMD